MFYYLWIIKIVYFDPPAQPLDRNAGVSLNGVVLVTSLFTMLFTFTFAVGPVAAWADAAAQSLTH
jgi:NADH:ubiquinone oxidoreductase subunit 2 (subunit N)